ncbi:universal stress protein, partial [Xanthovirga aplysinae]|uniref:universal stress protein n=1 Tax=Xanthovirga aplysinae TaxID=2529853 RepID=UPI0012BB983E
MQKILCPVDFKDASLNAVNYAAHLAKQVGANLTFLYVIPEERPIVEEPGIMDEIIAQKEEARPELEILCEETTRNFGVSTDYLIQVSILKMEVEKVAEEGNYDLVVMGTGGVTTVDHYFFGSNASKVAENCSCPVITVPKDFYRTEVQNIVYASNYQTKDDFYIQQILELSKVVNASITVLHVSKVSEPFGEELFESVTNQIRKEFQFDYKQDIKFERVVYEDVEEGLRNYLYDHNVDLVAVLTKHRNFLE